MGEVYRAKDTRLDREVALKVLPEATAASPERLKRFEREAKVVAGLSHPNVVHLYSVEEADGVRFLTMELVEGKGLDQLIPDDGLPLEQTLVLGAAVADALAMAHARGIVHRDLKPANIMVDADGRPRVLDFGLAKLAADESPADTGESSADSETRSMPLTLEGAVMGTAAYMSPEQLRGETVDHRSDVFSLGVLLYEMATGRRAFGGHSAAEVASAILRDTPPLVTRLKPELPRHLARIVAHCLDKEPQRRIQSALDVRNELEALRDEMRMEQSSAEPPEASPGGAQRRGGIGLVAGGAALAVVVALVAIGYFAARSRGPRPAEPTPIEGSAPLIRSIAVLPLDNYSGDPAQDYFAEGMTDELTADLARISQLRVISRGSAMQFRGADRPATPEIARALNVDAVVEGSVLRSGDRVRITAQLIDARADRHLWAKRFESSSRDILAMQDELASAIASEIHAQLTPVETSRFESARSVDPEAYDAYLKGRYFFNRPSDENLQRAIQRFEEAVAISPDFVPALSGLSDAYLWAGFNEGFLTASEARPKAKAAAERAIELDDGSAEAHTSLAVFRLFYAYDWEGSEAEFRRAIELNPNYAYAHDQFALGLAFHGRHDEAIAEGRHAAELDPLSPQVPLDTAVAFAFKGDYEGARKEVRRAAELDPTYFLADFSHGWIEIQTGNVADAIPHLERSKAIGAPAFVSAWLTYAYAASGQQDRAAAELEELKRASPNGSVTPFNLALVALGEGEPERALSYLEQAHASDSQWLNWLSYDRVFDPLRAKPRFLALSEKLGLEV